LALTGFGTAEGWAAAYEDYKNPLGEGHAPRFRQLYNAGLRATVEHILTTDAGFRERLVWFWVNHFAISERIGETTGVMIGFIQEAIRPFVCGRFSDMLRAAITHPAMLQYLDNAASAGPGSATGQRLHRGLNENLARECLELHTVGADAGYTQADVTEFAKVLTGWSTDRFHLPYGMRFYADAHEPGPKHVMGQTVPEGLQAGLAFLNWLADHPATHRHLATKLVRHFVADDPPRAAVDRLERVLRDTHGDLLAVSLELIDLPEAWTPLAKLRSPDDYVIAVMRAIDDPALRARVDLPQVTERLGETILAPAQPNGWPDTAADWDGPDSLLRRIDWAWRIAGDTPSGEPLQLAQASLGPLLSNTTSEAIRRAGSRRDALFLLLASPEFQRR
jgi:uncharacterized protein (DUF1800 family)